MVKPIDNAIPVGGISSGALVGRDLLLAAFDTTDQSPTALDTPFQIEFGVAQGTPSDPVQVLADGSVIFNKGGPYYISLGLQWGRRTGVGTVYLFLRILVNGFQAGSTGFLVFDGALVASLEQLTGSITLNDGDTLTVEIMRDSKGVNDGGLITESTTSPGWFTGASAQILISQDKVV